MGNILVISLLFIVNHYSCSKYFHEKQAQLRSNHDGKTIIIRSLKRGSNFKVENLSHLNCKMEKLNIMRRKFYHVGMRGWKSNGHSKS